MNCQSAIEGRAVDPDVQPQLRVKLKSIIVPRSRFIEKDVEILVNPKEREIRQVLAEQTAAGHTKHYEPASVKVIKHGADLYVFPAMAATHSAIAKALNLESILTNGPCAKAAWCRLSCATRKKGH